MKYLLVAYPEPNNNLPRREVVIDASDHEDAKYKARRLFPEFCEVGAYDITTLPITVDEAVGAINEKE